MRIGIDARMYRKGTAGIGRYSQNLIKNLLELDHENQYVLFMTPADEREARDQLRPFKNYKIVNVDITHYSLAEQTKLAGIIDREKCDLVHFLNFNYPVRFRGKFIVTIHDLTLLFYPEAANKTGFFRKKAFNYVIGQACRKAAKVIAVSENTKNDIIRTLAIDPAKITVIAEAADDKELAFSPHLIEKLKGKYELSGPVILYVGQFRQHKNVLNLLKAFTILRKDLDAKLVLVGKDADKINIDTSTGSASTLSEVERVDKEEILRDTLRPGFVGDEELAAWYHLADVFVFPSLYEGFGLPGLEAMAVGLAVVASNKASLPEIYQEAALYFDPLKPEEIADKIKTVLSDQKTRDELIKKGKIQSKKYSWRKAAQETLKVYSEV